MKKVTFLGSKKVGWACFSELLANQEKLNIEIVQMGTNLSRNDVYKDHFLQFSSSNNIPLISDADDIFLDTDIIISVQYHHILSAKQINHAREAAYNLHMAPLPEYRGCNQFSFAILDKAHYFGTTIHVMDAKIDHGDIVAEDRFEIPTDIWVADLYDMTEKKSIAMFAAQLEALISGKLEGTPQFGLIPSRGTSIHYRHEIKAIKKLELGWPEEKIVRHIRATYMPGFVGPYFEIDGLKIAVAPA